MRNRENLSERQEVLLKALLQANEDISAVYVLKEQLKQIFRQPTVPLMALALDQWCDLAMASGLKPMAKCVRMLQSHRQGILNYVCHQIHTSKLAGINNKIKTLKRQTLRLSRRAIFHAMCQRGATRQINPPGANPCKLIPKIFAPTQMEKNLFFLGEWSCHPTHDGL